MQQIVQPSAIELHFLHKDEIRARMSAAFYLNGRYTVEALTSHACSRINIFVICCFSGKTKMQDAADSVQD